MHMPKRKRRGRPVQDEPVFYVLEIEDWDWNYSFSIDERRDEGPYMEFCHPRLFGMAHLPMPAFIQQAFANFFGNEFGICIIQHLRGHGRICLKCLRLLPA
jgi:hypothetical protein